MQKRLFPEEISSPSKLWCPRPAQFSSCCIKAIFSSGQWTVYDFDSGSII